MNNCTDEDLAKCWKIKEAKLASTETKIPPLSRLTALGEFPDCHRILSFCVFKGWGAYDATGDQSRYLRQVDLTLNKTTDCVCKNLYFLETNIGPEAQDTCEGDSG